MHKVVCGLFVLSSIIVFVWSAPLDDSQNAQILSYESENIGIDGYRFGFETSDGTSRQEQGEIKNLGTENEALSVQGRFSWIGDDGKQYTITFIADENGYQPDGDHIPRA